MNNVKWMLITGSLGVLLTITSLLRSHWIGVGEDRVNAKWQAQVLQLTTTAAIREAELLHQIRQKESLRIEENERITNDYTQREQDYRAHIDSLTNANSRLQYAITNYPSRTGRLSSSGTDASTSPPADGQATTARELLGECSNEYTRVATQADQLANQVIGLQQYANMCRSSQ